MSMKLARERVTKGHERLEEKRPDWRDMIDESRLNMCSEIDCIVGQVYYGDFCQGAIELFGPEWNWKVMQEYGFEADPGGGVLYAQLETAWREILAQPAAV